MNSEENSFIEGMPNMKMGQYEYESGRGEPKMQWYQEEKGNKYVRKGACARYDAGAWEKGKEEWVDEICKDPRACVEAVIRWGEDQVEPYLERFIASIVTHPLSCRMAGQDWKEEVFMPSARDFSGGISRSAEQSYEAGLSWKDAPFYATARDLIKGISGSEYHRLAKDNWPQRRRDLIEPVEFLGQVFFDRLPEKSQSVWLRDGLCVQPEILITLSDADLHLITEAHEFAQSDEDKLAFRTHLKKSLSEGTQQKWAKTIIEHFRRDTKGGAQYRTLEVWNG